MKVRCIQLLDTRGNPREKSGRLTVGKIYHVLEVVQDGGRWLLRLAGDTPTALALFQIQQFEIVSSKIPHSWIIQWGKDGFFELTPEPWSQKGFWERYYDGDSEAVRVFEEEARKIIESEP